MSEIISMGPDGKPVKNAPTGGPKPPSEEEIQEIQTEIKKLREDHNTVKTQLEIHAAQITRNSGVACHLEEGRQPDVYEFTHVDPLDGHGRQAASQQYLVDLQQFLVVADSTLTKIKGLQRVSWTDLSMVKHYRGWASFVRMSISLSLFMSQRMTNVKSSRLTVHYILVILPSIHSRAVYRVCVGS